MDFKNISNREKYVFHNKFSNFKINSLFANQTRLQLNMTFCGATHGLSFEISSANAIYLISENSFFGLVFELEPVFENRNPLAKRGFIDVLRSG